MRFLVGFGAGAARVEMEGEVIDTATGASVFRFLDARSGDDLFGVGESENLMEDDLEAMDKNIASAIAQRRGG